MSCAMVEIAARFEIQPEVKTIQDRYAKLKATGEAMLARLRPDPVIVAVMLSTGMLMLALALGYLGPR